MFPKFQENPSTTSGNILMTNRKTESQIPGVLVSHCFMEVTKSYQKVSSWRDSLVGKHYSAKHPAKEQKSQHSALHTLLQHSMIALILLYITAFKNYT